MTAPTKQIKNKNLLLIFLLFLISSGIVFFITLLISNLSLAQVYETFHTQYYTLEKNVSYYTTPLINFIFLSIALLTSALGRLLIHRDVTTRQLILCACVLTFGLSVFLQSIFHFGTFRKEYTQNRHKTISEQYQQFSKINYLFSENSHLKINQTLRCNIHTDLDFEVNKYVTKYITLRYFMYPIDIHFDRNGKKSCAVYYWKENAIQHIPDNYKIVVPFTDKHIIAVENK